ncbi:hypothetical protein D3C87_1667040 [compost metagenome]
MDRHAHIRSTKLCDNTAVAEFHVGVDNALRVKQHIHLLIGQAKQMVGFNHLKSLIDHGCRINRNFGTHTPVRMTQCVLHGNILKLIAGIVAERAA